MRDVILIRPGWTDFDEQDRIQGSLDLPLNPRGQEQVELLVQQLHDVRLDVVFSAPCEPARSTALAVCEACGATWKETADFRNLNHGLWQGLCVDDVRRKYPKVFKQWQESPETVCLPEGEPLAEALDRVERALRKCLKRKRSVGIVASEPLATLIGCILRGCRPELPCSEAQEHPERRIEFFKVAEDWDKEPVSHHPSHVGGNGGPKPANGQGHAPVSGNGGPHHGGSARKNGVGNTNGADGRNNGSSAGGNGSAGPPASTPRGAVE